MNYYEHHLGDYMRDTAHLSWLEDCAYRRLLDAYYVREKPLPVDVRECCKLARAASKPERDAVAYVLREFFELHDDGYHQRRADAEIGRFQDKQRKARASAEARWSHRPPHSDGNANASADAMRTHSEGNAPRVHAPTRAPARPQSPDTRPNTQEQALADTPPPLRALADGQGEGKEPPPEANGHEPTLAGGICRAMRKASNGAVLGNPGDPRFLALLQQGATEAEFVGLAEEAVRRGIKAPWPWILATLPARRTDAAAIRLAPQDASRQDASAPAAWHATAAGIKAKGAELGVPWSEDGWVNGQHYAFPAYTALVRQKAEAGDNRRAA